MNIKIKKLHPDAIIPTYATDGAGCFDLYAVESATIYPGRPVAFKTGFSFEIPKGQVLAVYSRSGHGFNHGIRLVNCAAMIDADYRGELIVKLTNDGSHPFTIKHRDRIAQAKLEPAERVTFTEVSELSETARQRGVRAVLVLRGRDMKPLFIPLKTEYFEAFANGRKREELRRYGPRWNERTCVFGREVTLSKGYGKKSRLAGKVWQFKKQHGSLFGSAYRADILKVFGTLDIDIACISIELT